MARTSGTSSRAQRLIATLATCLLGATTGFALGRVFLGAAATWRLLVAAIISGVLASALERRNLALAAFASAVGLLVVVGLLIFPGTTWHGLPTLDTLREIAQASRLVGQQARLQVSPTPPLQPLMLAALTASWAAVFSAHALAFRAGSPLLALLPPLALVAFADTVLEDLIKPFYGVVFLVAALIVIFADGLRRVQSWGPVWTGPGRAARLPRSAGRGARRVAFAAVGLALVSPLLIPGFGSKALLDLSGTGGDGVSVDVLVSVANQLKRNDVQEIFTVQTSRPTYYRLLSLTEFDGLTWRPDANAQATEAVPGSALTPVQGLSAEIGAGAEHVIEQFRTTAKINTPLVPLAYPPLSIDMGVPLHWDFVSGTAGLDGPLDSDTGYTVTSLALQPAPGELRALSAVADPNDPSTIELPPSTPPGIAEVAHAWTDTAPTSYDKVIAIQDHLLDPEVFSYDPTVPAQEGSNAMLNFLTKTRTGFCQQFSSAMAVLLRSLGIPARVAVGYTNGVPDKDVPGMWRVTTDNAHAWVEVLFPGYGWLPFEPTPGRTNPVAAAYTNPNACLNPQGVCAPSRGGAGGGGETQEQPRTGKNPDLLDPLPLWESPLTALDVTPVADTRRFGARAALALALIVVLVGFLLLPPARALRRRLRLRRATASPRELILATYEVFVERAGELGYRRSPGETLEEYRQRLTASGLLRDGHLDRLTRITAAAAYAPQVPDGNDSRAATAAAATTLRDIRRGTPLAMRMRGRYLREP